ncbi:uncharacterized protein LOC110249210 [Exaiptasia diaphana]|uniref:F5/8 type C domain-containing protein n=1 Tax=Exaiptasia diaphana TaxID=2652724 RepID=A0A913XXS1_EXADI|nr:uncharacterized protein LOC110249210 [Exaiptasia diaphana]
MWLRQLCLSAWLLFLLWAASEAVPPGCTNFDFEKGNLYGWTPSGDAFKFQPTLGDNPTARRRGQPAKMQGRYWIGTFEKRPNTRYKAGTVQGDRPRGTLMSRSFRITGNHIDFLVGGGSNVGYVRVELVIHGRGVVYKTAGRNSETMRRQRWSVHAYKGRTGFIRLVDYHTGGWGHINFDDLRGGIRCEKICNRPFGFQSGVIKSSAVTSTSQWSNTYRIGRLNKNNFWIARINNRYQWTQVDFGKATKVTAVATQGRANSHQWVTRYTLSYSSDGILFAPYKRSDNSPYVKYFTGNHDRHTIKVNHLIYPIRCQYLRLHPYNWRSHISMRMEVYGCHIDKCKLPVGLEDYRIQGGQLSASSFQGTTYHPSRARLNVLYGWTPRGSNRNQWLQIEFIHGVRVKGVATQGRSNSHYWVTQYYLTYSSNGMSFRPYKFPSSTKYFRGNSNMHSIVYHDIERPFVASFLRFRPTRWRSYISMRVEVYGCSTVGACNKALGMYSTRIKAAQITASTYYNNALKPEYARLNRRLGQGSWSARHNNHNQFLQVDFGTVKKIVQIATQSRHNVHQWVTSFWLSYSIDKAHWVLYKYKSGQSEGVKTFQANRDIYSTVYNPINPGIKARYVQIKPRGWRSHISMRVEFYGCATDKCMLPLGMEDKRINIGHLKSSTMYNPTYAPWRAGLHTTYGWLARTQNANQWIQVDLETPTHLRGIATQGRHNANQWVKQYRLSYGNSPGKLTMYREGGRPKVFIGNNERQFPVFHLFNKRDTRAVLYFLNTCLPCFEVTQNRNISLFALLTFEEV